MHIPKHILQLSQKMREGVASPEEIARLHDWYDSFNDSAVEITLAGSETGTAISGRIYDNIFRTIDTHSRPALARRWAMPAAAMLLLLFAIVIYLQYDNPKAATSVVQPKPTARPLNDAAPGGNKALLTLADGSSVVLDSAANGTISTQGNISIKKLANGLLAYTINGKEITQNGNALYNTISTPRGGQYKVTLSDGTTVWLNAASSIRFPVLFAAKERNVHITGEAYFEVAKTIDKPFIIKTAGAEVEVLGTQFNLNAYEDEPLIKTTLLEGGVKVSAANAATNTILKPGQQAGIDKKGLVSVVQNADTEEALAWKNGRFQFKSADIKTILRQVSRWYDVDVLYTGNVDLHFTGQLTKNEYASKLFEALALTGEVAFKIEGKTIIVSP